MFTLNNNKLELRNLEEQVQKNKEDIAKHYEIDRSLANFGIKIVGTVPSVEDLPDPLTYQGEYGDGYAVGQPGSYEYYIYTRPDLNAGQPNNHWLPVGQLAIQGPPGPQGAQGIQGEPGISSKWYTGQYPETPAENDMFLSKSGEVFQYVGGSWHPVTDIRGPQGIQGIQGPRGERGPIGPQGQKGDTGDVGGFINIYGIVTNTDQLPSPSTLKNLTIAYLLGTQAPYDLYIQVGENSNVAQWTNSGPFNAATLVSSGGVYQNIWNADTKVNSITDNPGYRYVYAQSPNGVDSKLIVATSPPLIENIRIPQYWINTDTIANTEPSGKGVLVTSTPTQDFHCATMKYVDDEVGKKLTMVTDNEPGGLSRVYAVSYTGEQRMIMANPNEGGNQLVQRNSSGRARVNEPVHEKDIANKKYVDDSIASSSALYKRTLKIIVGEDEFRVQAYTTNNDQINFSTSDGPTIANYINSKYGNSVAVRKAQTTIASDFFNSCSYNEGQTPPITYDFLSGGYTDGTFNVTETIT